MIGALGFGLSGFGPFGRQKLPGRICRSGDRQAKITQGKSGKSPLFAARRK
jgi:hypothetical protein